MSWVLRSNVARPELVQVVACLKRTCNANRSFLVLRLFNLDDDDELLFNDEFDNITLNLDDKLLNAVYDIRYNCQRLSGTYKESQQRAVERFSTPGAGVA